MIVNSFTGAGYMEGMRGVLAETVVNAATPDAKEAYGGMEYARKFIQQFHGDGLITPAFAPHAPYSVNAEHLRMIQIEAEALDVPILMHVAEMPDEVASIKKNFNQTPTEYLDGLGLLSKRLVRPVLVMCVLRSLRAA